jgi:hypothetical protein
MNYFFKVRHQHIVAGCLGYDVLVNFSQFFQTKRLFQLLVV